MSKQKGYIVWGFTNKHKDVTVEVRWGCAKYSSEYAELPYRVASSGRNP